MERQNQSDEAVIELVRKAVDQGRLLEEGWLALKHGAYPDGMATDQERQLRCAFFAGAQHLFSSQMLLMDPGQTMPTDADLNKMELIRVELEQFAAEFAEEHGLNQ